MSLTAQHKRAMAAGRARQLREDRSDAVRRVVAYTKWLKAGSNFRQIPEIPSDSDYQAARRAGRIP